MAIYGTESEEAVALTKNRSDLASYTIARNFQTYARYHKTAKQDNIAEAIATVHIGSTVLLRYPTPNWRKSPSVPYAKLGLK